MLFSMTQAKRYIPKLSSILHDYRHEKNLKDSHLFQSDYVIDDTFTNALY